MFDFSEKAITQPFLPPGHKSGSTPYHWQCCRAKEPKKGGVDYSGQGQGVNGRLLHKAALRVAQIMFKTPESGCTLE